MGNISTNLVELAKVIESHGEKIYIVGGYVRNELMSAYDTDIDLAGSCDREAISKLSGEVGFKCQVVNEKLGTCLLTKDIEQYEYTPFRTEEYDEGGHHMPKSIELVKDIDKDVTRRDFTINSMYYDIVAEKYIDIFNAKRDIEKRLLKCIISPEHVFCNDGLRILRMVRLACELGLKIDKDTYSGAKSYSYQLKDISKDRILKELRQMVVCDTKNKKDKYPHIRILKLLNNLKLWGYILNNEYDGFKIATFGKSFDMYKYCKPENRLYALLCLIYSTKYKTFDNNNQIMDYNLYNLMGNDGLKIQKSVPQIKSILLTLRDISTKSKSVYEQNRKVIAYNNLNDGAKNIISSGYNVSDMEKRIEILQSKNIPFKISDIDITSKELIDMGVENKALAKVYSMIVFELLSETINNVNADIKEFVSTKLTRFIK